MALFDCPDQQLQVIFYEICHIPTIFSADDFAHAFVVSVWVPVSVYAGMSSAGSLYR